MLGGGRGRMSADHPRRRVIAALTHCQGAVESNQGVKPWIAQVPSAKLGNPALGQRPRTGGRERRVRRLAGPETVPKGSQVSLHVHGKKSNNKLLEGQATNYLPLGLALGYMKKPTKTILAENVERLMKARGWTQTALAKHSGIRQTTISAILTQKVETGVDKLELLAHAFKLPPWAMLIPNLDEAMFQPNGLGDVVTIYPSLPDDGRTEIVRIAQRERRYLNAVPKLPPPTHPPDNQCEK